MVELIEALRDEFFPASEEQIANTLSGVGLVGMFRLGQSIEEQRQIEAVVQLVNIHLQNVTNNNIDSPTNWKLNT